MDPSLFATAARYCAILAGGLAIATLVLWIRNVKWRFAFFGYTAFTVVLSFGLAALSLGPIVRTSIPGAAPFVTVFDDGSTRAAIAVSADISPETLSLSLEQAAQNLYSAGRYASTSTTLTIRARAIIHPEEGITEPIYLGEVKRSLLVRNDPEQTITIDWNAFDRLEGYLSNA